MYQEIIVSQRDGIARLVMNRPQVLNALTPNMMHELRDAAQQIANDPNVRVLVLTGTGRAFSAGVDLKNLNEQIVGGQFTSEDFLHYGLDFINIIQTMPQVTIAAVNGYCYTGATELMLAFDLAIAAEEAQIGDTHTKWGLAPKWGMTQRLPQKVGINKAMELSFTAQPIGGTEAARIGLVNRAVPLANLDTEVENICKQIVGNSPQTIAGMKQLYYQGALLTLKEGLAAELDNHLAITDRTETLRNFKK
ncbi:MAG: enoyl-CoA hydratase/isomerase family protein [Bernardetiaceae bacterium]|jgi:enoyl-CoA hydratase/carnithine racemase|nr:enoyl-CoA hydratase/isomerase family protein [Bernardetiaceae bacterium]